MLCHSRHLVSCRLLQALENQLELVDLELEENAGRISVMDEHMKNVKQEITYAQHRVRNSMVTTLSDSRHRAAQACLRCSLASTLQVQQQHALTAGLCC